jgi:hypothetical protein
MRKSGVFAAFALSWITASCAERMANPAVVPEPPALKAAPKTRPANVEVRRQAERIAEKTRKNSTARSRQFSPSVSVKPEQPPKPQVPPPQASQQPQEPAIGREPPSVVALPPPKPAEPNFPFAALMPPPPEPAEPTFPSVPPAVELPSPPEPTAPILPQVPIEAAMPPPPEPAEPSLPVSALMPPPPKPAEPSLPSQEEIIAESSVSVPLPDLPSYLSLRPRFDWVDTVGAIEVPHSPLSEAFEASPQGRTPSLIQNPWPFGMDAS